MELSGKHGSQLTKLKFLGEEGKRKKMVLDGSTRDEFGSSAHSCMREERRGMELEMLEE